MHVNVHSWLSSVMLVCKNAIITFWNSLWSKSNKQINFITVLFFHAAPLHFMENKAHFVTLIRPRKVQYMPIGVSSQQNRIWNMEWNDATVQTGVPMSI